MDKQQNDEWEEIKTNPAWDFEEEEELIGFFVDVETEVGPNKSNLYTFRKEDGDIIGVWGNTILDNRLRGLEMGDKIKIIYRGKVKSPKTGREYNDFRVLKAKKKETSDEEIPVVEDELDNEL